jgi:hypothetical protein
VGVWTLSIAMVFWRLPSRTDNASRLAGHRGLPRDSPSAIHPRTGRRALPSGPAI